MNREIQLCKVIDKSGAQIIRIQECPGNIRISGIANLSWVDLPDQEPFLTAFLLPLLFFRKAEPQAESPEWSEQPADQSLGSDDGEPRTTIAEMYF